MNLQRRNIISIVSLLAALIAGLTPLPSLAAGRPQTALTASAPSPAIPSNWLVTVQNKIRQAEYSVTWQEQTYLTDLPAAYHAPNRAHNLRTYFGPAGPTVIPRAWPGGATVPPWRLDLTLTGYGRTGDIHPLGRPSQTAACDNRFGYYYQSEIVMWYHNDENGLEQGFTLSLPPPGKAPLQINLVIGGDLAPQLDPSGTAVDLHDRDGQILLRYGGLSVIDAAGQPLPAWLRLSGVDRATLSLIVDDTAAAYPIEVDPILTGLPADPDWSLTYVQGGARLGYAVATAGDVDGDGYSDVIVGAPYYDGGQDAEGLAAVFHGSAGGLEDWASWVKESDQANAHFGWSVATAGDVDGDGDTEVIVGAPYWDAFDGDEGGAWVYYGSPDGLSLVPGEYYFATQLGAHCGTSVATAGDVNGDGYADVIVGAPLYSMSYNNEGRVTVYYGSQTGLSDLSDWYAVADKDYSSLGTAVATAGDVNGDGYSDVIVGADLFDNGQTDEGMAFVWHGSVDGPNGGEYGTPANADWSAQSDQANAQFGYWVATAGDVNGDGYADVIVGAPMYSNGEGFEGAARLYLGSSTGLNPTYDNHDEGNQNGAQFGRSVSTAGDVNGDGYADLIVGAPYYTGGETEEGRAFVWYGSPGGISSARDWYGEGNAASAYYGYAVATAGDVNGDGYSDIIVGAPGDASFAGSAFAYYGAASSLAQTAGWTKVSNKENAHFGHSVASAGDVNADGYADVIVGSPDWDGGQDNEGKAWVYLGTPTGLDPAPDWYKEPDQAGANFGWSVGAAGDVDGDGYDDVVVGGPNYDDGQNNEGGAWVYLGSSSGLDPVPAWYKQSDQAEAQFGYAVGAAGDVNGDGYGDVIVGAPLYNSPEDDEGEAWVYHGSADGLHTIPDWHAESDQADAQFGFSVGTAGDINADGCSDVIVGSPFWDNDQNNEGGAWVYFGSPSGLSENYRWRQDSDQTGATFGYAVGTAGDVNGDGHADVIVGAPQWDNGQEGEGKAVVFHSSGLSLYLDPAWTKEPDQTGAHFGHSVGTAGDVNGDGYADVVVGADLWSVGELYEGGAWVYHGSPAGLHLAPDWHAEADQASAHFGQSVATAGDVNGDGYADVVVGAPWHKSALYQEGQASLFYGNGGKGAPVQLYQFTDAGQPIAHLGRSSGARFRLKIAYRNPFGRGDMRFGLEVKPLGSLFNGAGVLTGSGWIDPLPGTVETVVGPELPMGTPYHWRLRVIYRPSATPWMPASRWVTIPWNSWNEIDLWTGGHRVVLPLILRNY